MLFQMVSHMTKFNASCRKKLTFKLSKKKKTPCSLISEKNNSKLEPKTIISEEIKISNKCQIVIVRQITARMKYIYCFINNNLSNNP